MNNFLQYLDNNYIATRVLEYVYAKVQTSQEEIAYNNILAVFNSLSMEDKFTGNETDLQNKFITKVLNNLGYSLLLEQSLKVQGKNYAPDYLLFKNKLEEDEFKKLDISEKHNFSKQFLICEAKASKQILDTNKVDVVNNPHYQIINYLMNCGVNYGLLTNGQYFRLYDGKNKVSNKVYLQFNLYSILENNDQSAFNLFYRLFNANYFFSSEIQEVQNKQIEEIKYIEQKIGNIIYGTEGEKFQDSLMEKIGSGLYLYLKENNTVIDTKELFHNSVVLMFRLIFLFYYESKFKNILEQHSSYKQYSIYEFLNVHILSTNKYNPLEYNIYGLLIEFFKNLATGNTNLEIPMLNGGLFAENNAPLLNNRKIFNNKQMEDIFTHLILYKSVKQKGEFIINTYDHMQRDFSMLDIKKLGEIYENLLQYEFRIAQNNTYLINYKNKEGQVLTYVDALDLGMLKQSFKDTTEYASYNAGDLYLVTTSNSRKQSASYYTPESLTKFMCVDAIAEQVEKFNKKPFELRILDNACGSGHFLVDSLNVLMEQCFTANFIDIAQEFITAEKVKIEENLAGIGIKQEEFTKFIDEGQVLKRILLKRCIYGVDYNILAIEIAKLALWMETFIFATPLSFIEHHIKCGNSLIGTSIENYIQEEENVKQFDLLMNNNIEFTKLAMAVEKIININDTTSAESKKSKEIYNNEVVPISSKYNELLNLLNYFNFLKAQGKEVENLLSLNLGGNFIVEKVERGLLKNVFDVSFQKVLDSYNNKNAQFMESFASFQKMLSPFNMQIEFPEVFTYKNENKVGFDVVIGNPPWEETAYNDKDFFSQYNSAYRNMTIAKKSAVREKYLVDDSYSFIKAHYIQQKSFIGLYNNYLKASFPLNAGAGDNNLYKFFIENNLKLIKDESGTLSYVTPSIWVYAKGAVAIRQHIFENYELSHFYQFENRGGVFPNVHKSYKFAVYKITHQKPEKAVIKCRFMQQDPNILYTNNNIMELTLDNIKHFSNDYSIMEINSIDELTLLKKLFSKFEKINDDYMRFSRELDLTNDKHLMQSNEPYIQFTNELHLTKDRNLMNTVKSEDSLVMLEGKCIHQFNNKFSPNNYFVNRHALEKNEKSKEIYRLKQALKNQGVESYSNDIEQSIDYNYKYYRLGFRSIASATNEKTLIATVIPLNTTFGNSINASIPKQYHYINNNIQVVQTFSYQQLFFLSAMFNSFIIDYQVRKFVDMNVNIHHLQKLSIPQPTTAEIINNSVYSKLMENSIKLHYMYAPKEFQEVIDELNINTSDIPASQTNFEKYKITKMLENDCLIAQIYELSKTDMELIIDSFKVFNKNYPFYKEQLLQLL